MTDVEKIQKFIIENQALLDEGRWADFYTQLMQHDFIGNVSYMLLMSGIDVFSEPNGLISIPREYMYKCAQLTEFTLPKNIIRINDNAFMNCINLSVVDLRGNESLHSIGSGAFLGCENLREISLPKSLKIISKAAFYHTFAIEVINYNGTQEEFKKTCLNSMLSAKPDCKINCVDGTYVLQDFLDK